MNISISKLKLVWKFVFGGKEAVLDFAGTPITNDVTLTAKREAN